MTALQSTTLLILRCEPVARRERISRSLDATASLEGRTCVVQGARAANILLIGT